jgi:kumamolisin
VERFFQTEIHTVLQDGYGARYANIRPGVLADALVSIVKNVKLDNLFVPYRPKLHRAPMSGEVLNRAKQLPETAKASQVPAPYRSPSALTGPLYDRGGALGPVAVAKALDFPVQHGYDGRHVNVGILMGSDVTDADLLSFFAAFQIPHRGMVYRAQVNGGGGVDPIVGLETALDVETIGSLAPGANTTIYMLPVYYDNQGNPSMSSNDIDTAMQDIAFYNNQDVVSISLGGPEAWDDAFQQAALQGVSEGITFCAAAGDAGDVESPASVPFVLAVGGTDMTVTDSGNMLGNIVWNHPPWGSTGGGVSSLFTIASYQVGVSGLASRRMRNVPDVALPAQNVSVLFQGQFQSNLGFEVDGTSWSCPIFAALMASAVQYHGRLGMVQNFLYRDYRLNGERDFIDIAWGWNGTNVSHYGYDNCSGIGCPRGWLLVVLGL